MGYSIAIKYVIEL